MTVVVACTDGSTELVAVTDTGKLPRGVPCVPVAPRHPANANTASKPTKNIPMRSLALVLFRPPAKIRTNPNSGSGNSRTAYTGAVFPGPHGRAEADPAVVAMVMFTVPVSGSCKDGLSMPNVQVAPNGRSRAGKVEGAQTRAGSHGSRERRHASGGHYSSAHWESNHDRWPDVRRVVGSVAVRIATTGNLGTVS